MNERNGFEEPVCPGPTRATELTEGVRPELRVKQDSELTEGRWREASVCSTEEFRRALGGGDRASWPPPCLSSPLPALPRGGS